MAQNVCTDANPPAKKKRNLPGTPDPEAEVIALSPRTLLATNRFLCEICGKGFQRDQNLQLHRRGHNLPWKLRQRSGKEPRKRVYVCPEEACVHHNPARALGDLTGIKKHFCRKHGEKKWKCDKCAKRYAVQSDWKAHSKTCGKREYRCDCGTLFSRRDSFITHRAFCDALAEETARVPTASNLTNLVPSSTDCGGGGGGVSYLLAGAGFMSQGMLQELAASNILKPDMVSAEVDQLQSTRQVLSLWMGNGAHSDTNAAGSLSVMHQVGTVPFNGDLFSSCANDQQLDGQLSWISSSNELASSSMPTANAQQLGSVPSLFSTQVNARATPPAANTSATALLQKAAQIGVTCSATPFIVRNTSDPASNAEDAGGKVGCPFSSPSNLHSSSNMAAVLSDFTAYRRALKLDELGAETRDFLGVGAPEILCRPPINGWI